jgi:predicted ribosome quality control (RQC) complex YloA/Tae2 family protein
VQLLRVGRHFRFGKNKIIVGRNKAENDLLLQMKMANDYCFEAQDTGSPITLLQGPKTRTAVKKAAELTAYYSDKKEGIVSVKFDKGKFDKSLNTPILGKEKVEALKIV